MGKELHKAVSLGDVEAVRLLVDRTVFTGGWINVTEPDELGNTPLHLAAIHNDSAEISELLLRNGAHLSLNKKNSEGNTPLILAAENKHHKVLRFLLGKGAKPNEQGKDGKTALYHIVSLNVKTDSLLLLLRCDADPEIIDFYQNSPLSYAKFYSRGSVESLEAYGKELCDMFLSYIPNITFYSESMTWRNRKLQNTDSKICR
jgi:hypothetical protein